MESSCYLCDDLIRDILVRLPTKSLLRFKSISKSWSSSISDPCFRRNLNSPNLIITDTYRPQKFWFIADPWSPSNLENLDLPAELDLDMKTSNLLLIGSCNGLLLLTNSPITHLWMLNASTRECCSIDIPKARRILNSFHIFQSFGFGYDAVNDDYKVIRILSYEQNHDKVIHETFVYSLRNNAWRTSQTQKRGDLDSFNTIFVSPGVLVGGKLHWFAHYYRRCILAFDVSNEYFEELSAALPEVEDARSCFGCLGELGGCLSITELKNSSCVVAVWALKESGWVRLFKTKNEEFRYRNPLAYSKNGYEVLMYNSCSCVWYNKENEKVDKLFSLGIGRAIKITMCLDTLVSIRAYRSHEED